MSIDGIGSDWPLSTISKAAPAGETNTVAETPEQEGVSLTETRSEQPAAAEKLTSEERETPLAEEDPQEKASDPERFRRTVRVFQRVLKELQTLPVFSDLVEAALPEVMREDLERDAHPGLAPLQHGEAAETGEDRFARGTPTFDRKA